MSGEKKMEIIGIITKVLNITNPDKTIEEEHTIRYKEPRQIKFV